MRPLADRLMVLAAVADQQADLPDRESVSLRKLAIELREIAALSDLEPYLVEMHLKEKNAKTAIDPAGPADAGPGSADRP